MSSQSSINHPPPTNQQQQPQQQPQQRYSAAAFDAQWVARQDEINEQERHALQGRLSTAQAHLHKDAIRNAYLALAEHDRRTGGLQQQQQQQPPELNQPQQQQQQDHGLSSLLRSMDYCGSRQQTAQVGMLILEVCLSLRKFGQVREYVTKLEHDSILPEQVGVQLKVALGLERLAQGDFEKASQIFSKVLLTSTAADLEWPGVASPQDIALYTSLLALACQPRSVITTLAEHPEALELVPFMKELLGQWSRANYADCLDAISTSSSDATTMTTHRDSLIPLGDLYLTGNVWTALKKSITETCILQYLEPYQTVQLDRMAALFPSLGASLEDILVDLMSRGLIKHARIDARNNVLIKKSFVEQEQRPTVHQRLAGMEHRVLDDVHGMLIRLSCLEHDLVVRESPSSGRRGGGIRNSRRRLGIGLLDHQENDSDDDDVDVDDQHFKDYADDDRMNDAMMRDAGVASSAVNPEDLY